MGVVGEEGWGGVAEWWCGAGGREGEGGKIGDDTRYPPFAGFYFLGPRGFMGPQVQEHTWFRRWTDFGGGWRGEAGVAETMGMLKGSGAKGG